MSRAPRYRAASERLARLHTVAAARAGRDPAHDLLHVERVAAMAAELAPDAEADPELATAAALLHELVNLPKDHPERARSGELCAEEARAVLGADGAWSAAEIDVVCGAIAIHGFSRGVHAEEAVARALQDADRLDALGAIGIARLFSTSGTLARPYYHADDPLAAGRPHDDVRYALDHFFVKILKLPERLHTRRARELAAPRVALVRAYLTALADELGVTWPA